MKTLHYFLMVALAAVVSFTANAQSIYEMVQNGTYYADDNYTWYEFGNPVGGEYSSYTSNPAEDDTSIANGWLQGWVSGGDGMSVAWDLDNGVLTATSGEATNDNGYTSHMIKPGTPQVLYNTQAYPYIAVKFKHLPACGEGGWQDGSQDNEKMYGGTRLHVVERAATAVNGSNSDFWLRIPRNTADATDMMERTQDNVEDWLTAYSPNDVDTIYIFNLAGAVMRNHEGSTISSRTDAVIDFYFIACDVIDPTDVLSIEWFRSFYDEDEAKEYADDLFAISKVKNVNELAVDILSQNGKIVTRGIADASIEVFNYLGQTVAQTPGTEIEVVPGNYIVKVSAAQGTKTVKLIHK